MTMSTQWFQGNRTQEGDNTGINPQHERVFLKMKDGRVVKATRDNARSVVERGEAEIVGTVDPSDTSA